MNEEVGQINLEPKDRYNPLVRTLEGGAAFAALYGLHRHLRSTYKGYNQKLYDLAVAFEEKSPNRIGRTFGLSDKMQSFIHQDLTFSRSQLVSNGALNELGDTFQRQISAAIGKPFDVLSRAQNGLSFKRAKMGDAALDLIGFADAKVKVRFAQIGGHRAGVASRLNGPLVESTYTRSQNPNPVLRGWENFKGIKSTQLPKSAPKIEGVDFFPYVTKATGGEGWEGVKNFARGVAAEVHVNSLSAFERPQRLLADVGLGVKGPWNKVVHFPGLGEGGLINKTLTTRVLPIALGLTALGYLDYKLGHPSDKLLDVGLKANVLRADLTDQVPGGRKITDLYSKVVPGPQYGPVALPIAGLFVGGLYHYSRVLKGLSGDAREAGARLLPKFSAIKSWAQTGKKLASVEGVAKIWGEMGAPGKGFAVGFLAMFPFIPGMLGSRKTGQQLRDIYSGAEPVPIHAGRWWDLGTSPFGGVRIKEWRPHWSLLHKSRAEDSSVYGSEEEKWSHNPLLHPLRWLKDPYWLEKKNYYSRPYPVTSPAFSNVPLIGPLLAATVGRLFKPEVRMHEDEWNDDQYHLYSSRLEPRAFRTESKLEKDLLKQMSEQGIVLGTQESVGNYRIDFSARGDKGQKIAIEADGITYHTNKAHDKHRQEEIEKKGWKVLRVRSDVFFKDPEGTARSLANQLHELGIASTTEEGRDVNSGLLGLAPPKPDTEFSLKKVIKKQLLIGSEYTGLIGFIDRSIYNAFFPNQDIGQEVDLQGSRQMTNISRRYYEKELGAGLGPNPTSLEQFGYTEPLRRFIQPESTGAQANDIPNEMPSWIPGEDYYTNFHKGDPYVTIPEGYARLPGAGYEALHPELKGVDPEDYPDIVKMSILADIAPYSREFNSAKLNVQKSTVGNTEAQIEYEKILDRVRQTRDSVIAMEDRRFTAPTESIDGEVESVGPGGVTLKEYPGRRFTFSSIGFSAADLSAAVLAEHNDYTRSQVAGEVNSRRASMGQWFKDQSFVGKRAKIVIPKGAAEHAEISQAVISINGENLNKKIFNQGYGNYRKDLGGAEAKEIFGPIGKLLGGLGESLSFQGDSSMLNPMRYLASPGHTKFWQERTPLAQYLNNEVIGTRMRRWQRPIHDFILPYFRGAVKRTTNQNIVPNEVQARRDLNTLSDNLEYLRDLNAKSQGTYTSKVGRTSIGADQFASPIYLASTLSSREGHYFNEFLKETDPNKREEILNTVSPEMERTLSSQWAATDSRIKAAEGKSVNAIGEGGRLYKDEDLEEYKKAKTNLDYGNFVRSKEIASFFSRTGFTLPEKGSSVYDSNIDYEDVKLKIIQQEGYDANDFNIFDDRSALLWRKPYIDGAVRELTSGQTQSSEDLRRAVEQLMLDSGTRNPNPSTSVHASRGNNTNVKVNVDVNNLRSIENDIRRNKEKYQD